MPCTPVSDLAVLQHSSGVCLRFAAAALHCLYRCAAAPAVPAGQLAAPHMVAMPGRYPGTLLTVAAAADGRRLAAAGEAVPVQQLQQQQQPQAQLPPAPSRQQQQQSGTVQQQQAAAVEGGASAAATAAVAAAAGAVRRRRSKAVTVDLLSMAGARLCSVAVWHVR